MLRRCSKNLSSKSKPRPKWARSYLVPGEGFEPSRDCSQRILSPSRLPFRHPGFHPFVTLFSLSGKAFRSTLILVADVIAIANEKGGTGKTTTAVNVAAHLAATGKRVLLVDADPQANATQALGFSPENVAESVYHVLIGDVDATSAVRRTQILALDVLPASQELAGATVELLDLPDRETRLRAALEPLRSLYDVIIVDCPPSLGILTVNALAAADHVVVPVDISSFAIEGLKKLTNTIDLIRDNLAIDVAILGAVLTMHERRSRLSRLVEREMRTLFPEQLMETRIPRSVHIAESGIRNKPVFLMAPESAGANAYRMLVDEVAKRLVGDVPRDEERLGGEEQ